MAISCPLKVLAGRHTRPFRIPFRGSDAGFFLLCYNQGCRLVCGRHFRLHLGTLARHLGLRLLLDLGHHVGLRGLVRGRGQKLLLHFDGFMVPFQALLRDLLQLPEVLRVLRGSVLDARLQHCREHLRPLCGPRLPVRLADRSIRRCVPARRCLRAVRGATGIGGAAGSAASGAASGSACNASCSRSQRGEASKGAVQGQTFWQSGHRGHQ
mmetsp:Transcript_106241/g.298796  ORF Transcript_106241/g.298796 Transcript_106241/m.298796 type:complete len:211 (+) Transcript_106241:364-996(+)